MNKIALATAIAAVLAPSFSFAADALDDVIVTASGIPTPDVEATYASEVHTRKQIEDSGAATLYDYLAQHTSLQVLPSYGNRHTPQIDMRGYGIGYGYQNIVVTLDGRRMNNIDLIPQLLGSIPLADIDRIEITKGSGSVMFGDGATAGSIHIYTRPHTGVNVQASAGNFGARSGTITAGAAGERISVTATADYSSLDGYSAPDVTGHRDESGNRTLRGGLELRPVDRLRLDLDAASTRIDTRYPGSLTKEKFDADPAQNGGNTYTHQKLESDLWRLGAEIELNRGWKVVGNHSQEDKLSDYKAPSTFQAEYDHTADDLALQYRSNSLDVTAGVQTFYGTRIGSDSRTSKDNTGRYLQGQYYFERTTLSAGGRAEKVKYAFTPNDGARQHDDHNLNAWDIGINHRLNERLSMFANYNRAFQAPDIDRFFNIGGTFNAFISPAKSRTINLGLNHVTDSNRLKLTVYRAELENEIFFEPFTFTNTNIDESHKYGLELQDTWRVTEALSASLIYTYTRAIIDHEDSGNGAFDGKDLPGVPRHGVTLGLAYTPNKSTSLNLVHTWRDSTWAMEDFDNNNLQKQAAYQSTDVSYQYRYKNLEWFASVENLLKRKNGLWIRDDAIYPVNFTRNWRIGMRANF